MRSAIPVRLIAVAGAVSVLGGCSDPGGADGNARIAAQQAVESGETPAADPTDEAPPLPDEFAQTAWRVRDEDGAVYITYLDGEGRYRDARNGDLWQEGAWEFDAESRLCFVPDAPEGEESSRQCWRPDRMDDADHMIVTSATGKRVMLERADYRMPESDEAAGS